MDIIENLVSAADASGLVVYVTVMAVFLGGVALARVRDDAMDIHEGNRPESSERRTRPANSRRVLGVSFGGNFAIDCLIGSDDLKERVAVGGRMSCPYTAPSSASKRNVLQIYRG